MFPGRGCSTAQINGRCTFLLLLAIFFGGMVSASDVPHSYAAGPQWNQTGLANGEIVALTINPHSPEILYAATGSSMPGFGIYKTSNAGIGWSGVNSTYAHYSLALDPQSPSTVYAGQSSTVLKSLNAGGNWVELASAGTSTHRAIVIDPSNPHNVYLGIQDGGGVFKTSTGGSAWTNVLSSQSVIALAINPVNPQELYAGTMTYDASFGGIFRSVNAGFTWTKLMNSAQINALAIDPRHPETIYAGSEGSGVFKSTNSGLNWVPVNNGLTGSLIRALAIDPINTNIIYAGTWEAGIFRSIDSGASWAAVNNGLTNTYILSLVIDPLNPAVVYAGTKGDGVFKLSENTVSAYSIRGMVRDDRGTPLSGVLIKDNAGHNSTSGADGSYILSGLPAGNYTITASKNSTSFRPTQRRVSLPPVSTGQDFTLQADDFGGDWTFILYLAGDNNLYSELQRAVQNLEMQPSNPYVKIVVLFDGDGARDSRRFIVQPGSNYSTGVNMWDVGELNMGDPQTLIDFISWTRTNQPSDHYYLAIADHGRGTSGVAWDNHSQPDYLTTSELREVLRTVTIDGQQRIDILHYDTCLMAMLENVYQIQDYVDYMVASENLGWSWFGYDHYARAVTANTTAYDLAIQVADTYFNASSLQDLPRTISTLDTSQALLVRQAADDLASVLQLRLSTFKNQMHILRNATQKFDSRGTDHKITWDDEYIDLYDFAARLKDSIPDPAVQQAAQNVMNAVNRMVIAEHHQSGVEYQTQNLLSLDQAHGLSIYFPRLSGSQDYHNYMDHELFRFTFDSQWDEFLTAYFSVLALPVESPTSPERPPMLINPYRLYLPKVQH